jgi:hypothetical protein
MLPVPRRSTGASAAARRAFSAAADENLMLPGPVRTTDLDPLAGAVRVAAGAVFLRARCAAG